LYASLLYNGYQGLFCQGGKTTHPHLAPKLRIHGAIPPFPICLHGVGLN
jgi:hypothetical protein